MGNIFKGVKRPLRDNQPPFSYAQVNKTSSFRVGTQNQNQNRYGKKGRERFDPAHSVTSAMTHQNMRIVSTQ
jgi:hypothetical protein